MVSIFAAGKTGLVRELGAKLDGGTYLGERRVARETTSLAWFEVIVGNNVVPWSGEREREREKPD